MNTVDRRQWIWLSIASLLAGLSGALNRVIAATLSYGSYTTKLEPLPADHPLRRKWAYIKIDYCYRGWAIWWTGWKESLNRLDQSGQWCAFKISEYSSTKHGKVAYASCPGGEGLLSPGECFDVDFKQWQFEAYPLNLGFLTFSPQETIDRAKQDTLQRLLRVIDTIEKQG